MTVSTPPQERPGEASSFLGKLGAFSTAPAASAMVLTAILAATSWSGTTGAVAVGLGLIWLSTAAFHLGRLFEKDRASARVTTGRAPEPLESEVAKIEILLERIAVALESSPRATSDAGPKGRSPEDDFNDAVSEKRWQDAEAALAAIRSVSPDHPEVSRLESVLESGREQEKSRLLAEIRASREVGDPDRVIALHQEITVLMTGDALRDFERDLIRWFLGVIQRRMRTGSVRPDVAELAFKVAERFSTTPEGASLRASLPTLRRSAGLCPRCGGPFSGLEDACQNCLGTPKAATEKAL